MLLRLALLALLMLPALASATCESPVAGDYFVATDGNDTTGDGSIGDPYATIQKAVDTVAAGGFICVRAGTYQENIDIVGGTTATGTSGNVITLQGYPGETAIIDGGFVDGSSPAGGDGIHFSGTNGIAYWTIKNLTITNTWGSGILMDDLCDGTSSAVTSIVGTCFEYTGTFSNIVMENLHIHNINQAYGSNVAAIAMNSCGDCVVRDSHLHNANRFDPPSGSGLSRRAALIDGFGTHRALIEYNELHDAEVGYFNKRAYANTTETDCCTVQYNHMYDLTTGGGVLLNVSRSDNPAHLNVVIQYNVMGPDVGYGVQAVTSSTWNQSDSIIIRHNSIDAVTDAGIFIQGMTGIEVYGNIISSSDTPGSDRYIVTAYLNEGNAHTPVIDFSDCNVFVPGAGSKFQVTALYLNHPNAVGYSALANWQAATIDATIGLAMDNPDANTVQSDPKYRSATDFRLQTSSPAKFSACDPDGDTNLDIGAYPQGAASVAMGPREASTLADGVSYIREVQEDKPENVKLAAALLLAVVSYCALAHLKSRSI